jgi:hypothetical protein
MRALRLQAAIMTELRCPVRSLIHDSLRPVASETVTNERAAKIVHADPPPLGGRREPLGPFVVESDHAQIAA